MKYLLSITLLLILSAVSAFAVDYGSIKGTVLDTKTSELLAGATIRIEGTAYGSFTNRTGQFSIKNVPFGKYTLLISMIGYETKKFVVSLENSEFSGLEFKISEQPLQIPEISVSGKREQAVQDVPISISVIDSRAVLDRGNTKLEEAMRYVPGVEVNRDNISVRGSTGFSLGIGSRVALLLDGFPLLSGDQGDIKFDALPMFNVDRIEVIKGAGSALYGSSALGGVINVITREPQEKADFRIRYSTGFYTEPFYPQWKYMNGLSTVNGGDIGYTQKFGNFGLMLAGNVVQDNGFTFYNKSFRYSIFSKFKYYFESNDKLSLAVNFSKERKSNWVYWNSLDSATLPPTGTDVSSVSDLISNKFTSILEYNHIFDENNFLTARAGLFGTFFENGYDPNDTSATGYYRASLAYSYNAEVQMNSRFSKEIFLTYGGNFTLNNVDARIFNGVTNQNIASIYAQGEFSFIKNIILTAGGRYDYEKSSGNFSNSEVSPKLGLTYNSPFGVNFRASTGRGFRTATIAERFSRVPYAGFWVVPNPDSLKPEKSWSYEIGAEYKFKIFDNPFQIDFSVFRNEMDNLIEPTFIKSSDLSAPKIQFQNITKAVINGAELSVKTFLMGIIGIESGLMIMDPRDLTLNQTLNYRSRILWTNRLFIPIGPFELQADYRYKSRSDNIDNLLSLYIPNADARVIVHVIDARIIYNLKSGNETPLTFTLNVKNLLNYYYTEIVGNLGMTRQISLQIGANL